MRVDMAQFLIVWCFGLSMVQFSVLAQSDFSKIRFSSEHADFLGNSQTVLIGNLVIEGGIISTYVTAKYPDRIFEGSTGFRSGPSTNATTHSRIGPDLLLRLGTSSRMEFRFHVPSLSENGDLLDSPFQYASFGSKIGVYGSDVMAHSLTIMVAIPNSTNFRRPRPIAPKIDFSSSYRLGVQHWVRSKMMCRVSPNYREFESIISFGALIGTSPSEYFDVYLGSEILTSQLETYRVAMMRTGFSYLLLRSILIDFNAGIGLNKRSPNAQLGTGISVTIK